MNSSIETILYCTIFAGFLSILYGFVTGSNIIKSSPGNNRMQEIASAIQVGAKAYLNRQYKTIALVGVVVLVIITFVFNYLVGLDNTSKYFSFLKLGDILIIGTPADFSGELVEPL